MSLAYWAASPNVPLFSVLDATGQAVFTMPLVRLQDCLVVPPTPPAPINSATILRMLKQPPPEAE